MSVAARLTLFAGCLAVVMVAGWALGQIVAQLFPAFGGLPPGFEYLHDALDESEHGAGVP